MNTQSATLHQHTPLLVALDPRGLSIRSVAWCRSRPSDAAQARVTRSTFNAAGHLVSQWDPRLWADEAGPNITSVCSLSSQILGRDSVDAGWHVGLPGEGGELLASWDGRGTERRLEYDALLRPLAIYENDQCRERLQYGFGEGAPRNQCGQLVRHDDPVGTRLNLEFGLSGAVLEQTQHFLAELSEPDWPEAEDERDTLLEPGAGAATRWTVNPLGEVIVQNDARENTQVFAHTVAGQLKSVALQLNDQPEHVLLSGISYDAQGRVASETAGNGVVTSAMYGAEDGRLAELKAVRSNGQMLQSLNYAYDPAGNVIRIEDRAQPTRYFANQRIEPVSSYQYDTLYQLIEATGRESANANHGPALPDFQSPADPTQLANYTQTYRYDAGGNLQQITHVGAQNHSLTLVTARTSNRSLPVIDNQLPDEEAIAAAFDLNGNLRELQAGQTLTWDRRNQLQQAQPVVRETSNDDTERYLYDASGQRLRKVRITQAKTVSHRAEVRYLPGLEIRTDTATGENLQVICVKAGRNDVRVLHWQSGKPNSDLSNDQHRYTLNDHLGSCMLELDKDALITSQESYYPFGGTSWWAGRNAIEASYKTVRYSGKERDVTGLYYYGLRYYAPWLQRWINPDPAGVVDGINLYRFVGNQPISFTDKSGLIRWPWRRDMAPEIAKFIDIYERKIDERGNRSYEAGEWDVEKTKLENIALKMVELPTLAEYVEGGNGVYHKINSYLRNLESRSRSTADLVKGLAGEFDELKDYFDVAYRGVKTAEGVFGRKIKIGDVVVDQGYMSASAIVRNSINWLEGWVDSVTEAPEKVMFIISKDVPKKIAGTGMLADHVLVKPGELVKVSAIHTISIASGGSAFKIVGLKPVGDIENHDIKNIHTGELLMHSQKNVVLRLAHQFHRWLTRPLPALRST